MTNNYNNNGAATSSRASATTSTMTASSAAAAISSDQQAPSSSVLGYLHPHLSSSTSIYNNNNIINNNNSSSNYNTHHRPCGNSTSATTSSSSSSQYYHHHEHKETGGGWTTVLTNLSTTSGGGRPPPCERSLHAATVLQDSLYVFGGYDGLSRVNDFYEFHFPSKCWREIITLRPNHNHHHPDDDDNNSDEGLIGGGAAGGGVGGAVVGMGGVNGGVAGAGAGGNRGRDVGHHHHQQPQQLAGAHALLGTVVTATGTVPSPRDRHAAVAYRSSIYIFGGFDGTSRVSDLYEFNVDRLVWREVRPRMSIHHPNNNNNNNILHDNDDNNNNAAENNLVAVAQAPGNNGMGQPPLLAPRLPPAAVAFDNIAPQLFHPPPSPRHSHAAVVYKNFMYIFGGYDGSYRSDFHEFDLDQLIWRPVVSVGGGRSPRARYRSTACVQRDMMILFGGHDGTRHLADVHLFDFVNQAWSLLAATGVPPMPRDSHVSVTYRDSMYVFGGSTGSAMNDLFELNFHSSQQEHGNGPEEGEGPTAPTQDSMANSAKWRQIPPVNGGIAVHRFCHVGAIYKGSLYVFGGYDGSSRLNDFVKYDLASDNMCQTDIPPPTILKDLRSFLDDEDVMSFADIILMVEDIPVRAHKFMLMRCPYFRAMLLSDMAESSQSVVNLPIVRHQIFIAVLEYLYTDNVVIPLDSAMELFVAADCFDIPRLQAMCERRLLASMTVENAASIFHAADVHSAVSLREKSLGYILSNFEAVSKTNTFEDMARSNVELVFEILKSR